MRLSSRCSASALVLLLALSAGMLTATASARAATLEPPKGLTTPAQAIPIPAFELPGIDGSKVRSADLRDKVTVIRFWATW